MVVRPYRESKSWVDAGGPGGRPLRGDRAHRGIVPLGHGVPPLKIQVEAGTPGGFMEPFLGAMGRRGRLERRRQEVYDERERRRQARKGRRRSLSRDEPAIPDTKRESTWHPPEGLLPPAADETEARSRTGRTPKWFLVFLVVVLGGGLLTCGALTTLGWVGSASIERERPRIRTPIHEFMETMSRGRADDAFALLSSRGKSHAPRSAVEAALEGDNFVRWHDYLKVELRNINVSRQLSGWEANVSGVVTYRGPYDGHFQAVLDWEDAKWRVRGITVAVPPEKIRALDAVRPKGSAP